MCTVKVLATCVVPAGTVLGPQLRVPVVIAQVPPQPAPWLAICHDRPAFTGSVSDSDTPYALPVPVLYTVSANPICSPAFTCAASAVFTMWIDAGLTTTGSSLQPLVNDLLFASPLNDATQ